MNVLGFKLLLIALLIVGCEKDDAPTTHEHDDGHFTCIWGTNELVDQEGNPVDPFYAICFTNMIDADGNVTSIDNGNCPNEVIGTPVDTIYYHAPDSNNAISQCTADAYYDDMEDDDNGQEQSSGDTVIIKFDDIILADENGNYIEVGVSSKYCTCEAGVLY